MLSFFSRFFFVFFVTFVLFVLKSECAHFRTISRIPFP